MAVAMEVARWSRGYVELDHSPVNRKKRAWGEDVQRVVQLMMGQLRSEDDQHVTLDLLGKASSGELKCKNDSNRGFLELDPDQPLPCGWEKCLDLKTGKLYFVNKLTGERTSGDPWKQQRRAAIEPLLAHEFLCSKQSETLREGEAESLRTSSSSESAGGSSDPRSQIISFSTKTLQQLRRSSKFADPEEEEEAASCNLLALDLNLAVEGSGCSSSLQTQPRQSSVCTMEMVQDALKRNKINRNFLSFRPKKQSGSSTVSSLTSIQSEPTSCCRQASPSTCTSSSSSTSLTSSSSLPRPHARTTLSLDDSQCLKSASTHGVGEAESKAADDGVGPLVMGACTRCLMYVMLDKSDPICPRCESTVPLDFNAPPSKRQRTVADHYSFKSNLKRHAVP